MSGAVVELSPGFSHREAARAALNRRVPNFFSIRLTAFDTVALDSRSSSAAPTKERVWTTFAKIANPSRSGSFDTLISETTAKRFYIIPLAAVDELVSKPEDARLISAKAVPGLFESVGFPAGSE